ncbi:MAG: hypothetical protein Q4D62_01105 [Planctomycetia bacterium]|nr:hypothetical protein [Planctomycetia bacterium]
MDDSAKKESRQWIQKYFDHTIQPEELAQLQKLLSEDAGFRRDFLLYAQVEVVMEEMVLFHNFMEEPSSLEKPSISKKRAFLASVPTCFQSVWKKILTLLRHA